MSRRLTLAASLAVLAGAVPAFIGAAPAQALPANCSEAGGVLTVTLPVDALADLTYVPGSDALVVATSAGTESVTCAAGHFTSLTKVDFAANASLVGVRLHMTTPWLTVAGAQVDVDLAALSNLSLLGVDQGSSSVNGHVTWDLAGNGWDLDDDSFADVVVGAHPVSNQQVSTGNGQDAINLTGISGSQVLVTTGAGDDDVVGDDFAGVVSATIDLGYGDDEFYGGPEREDVYPGAGADILYTDGGGDHVYVEPDGEEDLVSGGVDAYLYVATNSSADVRVSDNMVADDGSIAVPEDDNYLGFDEVETGDGDDVIDLAGIAYANAGGGDDVVIGVSGDRDVSGGSGFNTLDLRDVGGAVQGQATGLAGTLVTPGGNIEHTSFQGIIGTAFVDELAAECSTCFVEPYLGNEVVTLSGGGTFRASMVADGRDTVTGDGIASYEGRSAPVNVSLDVAADAPRDDGATGELDDIRSSGIVGGSGNDALSGDGAANRIDGSAGNDTILGRGGADTLRGDAGVDSVNGNNGNDEVRGGADNDTVRGGDGDDAVYGDETGQDFADTIDGGQGDDDEYGRGGDDTFLQGGNGFDNGSDVMDGGGGVDTVSYLGRTSGISASVNALFDDGAAGEGDQVRANVESLAGGNGDDVLTGAAAANTLLGNGGNDKLDGRGGDDIVRGGPGDDQFLEAMANNGADSYYGDDGTDQVSYQGRTAGVNVNKDAVANDGASGGAEGDNVRPDVERVFGTGFADVLIGSGIDDWLYGGAGDDTITGKAGVDSIFGDAGNDTIYAKDNKADTLDGGTGTDSSQHDAIDIRTLIEVTLP